MRPLGFVTRASVIGGIVLAIAASTAAWAQPFGVPGEAGASGLPPAGLLTQWQRVHGTIQEVEGSTLTIRADDGRWLTVDMSQIGEDVRGTLIAGEGATVIGVTGDEPNRLTARYVQQDPSYPSLRPRE